ncbi:hypothetical protein [Dyella telluris]|uniref:Uncharacterized protein n=1 Tax=Dyella telluris TaxID=2763498 RepID=A0A7G8PYY0_9GAMM|nr:hypothetical protein [Dyella telluris]QNJ99737.1 hypothetical protein H8F01_11295 [Dyella telluris]
MKRNPAYPRSRRWSRLTTLLAAPACCVLAFAHAQSAIPEGKYNLWLAEQAAPQAPFYLARMAGVASYKSFRANATLAFGCRTDGGEVSAELVVDPQALGFDADPYEGPGAPASGPIALTSGDDRAVRIKVSGSYGDGGPFNTGTPFRFNFMPGKAALARWTQGATRGKNLRIVVPASSGAEAMTVMFRWPDDDAVFRRVVTPCLGGMPQH